MKRYKQLFNEDRYEDTLRKSSFFSQYHDKIVSTKTYQEFQQINKQIIKQYVDEEKENLNDIPDVSKRTKLLKNLMREIGIELTDVWSALKNQLHEHWIDIKFSDIEKLHEGLRFSDLAKHSGLSNFTKKFQKDRQKKVGSANKSAKLLKNLRVNKSKDYIIFTFASEPTNKDDISITKPKSMKLIKGYTTYVELVKIKDIFKLLKTNPNFKSYKEVTIDDIKEVLKVCDVALWCDCPSDWYQGHSYYRTLFDASVYENNIEPKVWNHKHNENNILCKHLDMIMMQISYFRNLMTSMIYKYLQGQK